MHESPTVEIALTGGNLRQGCVSVRRCLDFFPSDAQSPKQGSENKSRPIQLHFNDRELVETDIDSAKGEFRWRGWRQFFKKHDLRAGDLVVITRRSSREYHVAFRKQSLFADNEVEDAGTSGVVTAINDEGDNGQSKSRRSPKRCNTLDGKTWLQYSISVWDDIRKSPEETKLGHPAMFPGMLVQRLIQMFLPDGDQVVLDPFTGTGSTIVAAAQEGKAGIGLDVSRKYIQQARNRCNQISLWDNKDTPKPILKQADARRLLEFVDPSSVDLCVTSPPYWNILQQKRTADYKAIRHYGNEKADLGAISDYDHFLLELRHVFERVFLSLKPNRYCVIIVMDLRKKDRFYPFHSDIAQFMQDIGFIFDDLIIWNRKTEYNNLRPLGYPSVFRVNKVHEFVLLFKTPKNNERIAAQTAK